MSLAVEAGELFGLLGPNGAGKTTLIRSSAGLTDADGGEVRLFGKPFTRADRDLRRLVGIGTQDLSIYPDLSARENLRFFGKLYGLGGKELETRIDEVLAAVGLTDRANDRAGTFSGGMKRRLNLAAAVVHGPKLLFLDEPTTGVDPQIAQPHLRAGEGAQRRRDDGRSTPATTWKRCRRSASGSRSSTAAGSAPATRCRTC